MTEHQGLVAALAAFHTEAIKVVKDATAKVTGESRDGSKVSYTYGYADLATVAEAVNPLLGKHGLAFISKPTMTPEGFGLVYALKHESNESEDGFWPLPDPTRLKPQEMGSWITYWRRYALLAVTNTFPSGEDDDGAKASSRESWDSARPQQSAQAAEPEIHTVKTVWTDEEIQDLHTRIETLPIGQAVNGYDWMASKNLHKRQINHPDPAMSDVMISASDVLAYRMADIAATQGVTLAEIADLRAWATDRGLLKVQVSESTTLDEELGIARDMLQPASGDDGTAAPAMSGTGD